MLFAECISPVIVSAGPHIGSSSSLSLSSSVAIGGEKLFFGLYSGISGILSVTAAVVAVGVAICGFGLFGSMLELLGFDLGGIGGASSESLTLLIEALELSFEDKSINGTLLMLVFDDEVEDVAEEDPDDDDEDELFEVVTSVGL